MPGSLMLTVPVAAEHGQQRALPPEQARQRDHERGDAEPRRQGALQQADRGAHGETREDRRPRAPARLDREGRGDGGGEAADGADGEIDLAQQQHEHDPDRDRADGGDLEREVGEVDRGEEAVVGDREDRPDDDEHEHDAQRAEIAFDEPAPGAAQADALGGGSGRAHWAVSPPVVGRGGTAVAGRAGDRSHHGLLVARLGRELAAVAPEPEHDDAVRDREDVGQVVGDEDDAEPALAQAADEAEHLRGLRDAERGGGLVEDHEPGLTEHRARDRDRLALAAGEHADLGAHRAQRAHGE